MNPYCCDAMKQAIAEGYFYEPIQTVELKVEGKTIVDMRVLPPAVEGPRLSPRSKKHRPSLIFSFCPFCNFMFPAVLNGEANTP